MILLRDVRGVGKKHDVKNVADGYARNFLIPKGLAKTATDEEIKKLDEQKAVEARMIAEKEKELRLTAKAVKNKEFIFELKSDGKSKVYGSIGKTEIENTLLKEGISVKKILLERPLKTLGEHEVEIDLGLGVQTKIRIKLLPRKD